MDVHKVPVVLYHDIDAVARPGLERWTTSPDEFREHVDVIAASGRTPLTISELAECIRGERRLERDSVVVSFDDGYASTYDAVCQLLQRGIGASIYITTGTIGAEGMLGPPQIQELARLEGVEIGAHSVSHPRLDEIAGAALEQEITGSKHMLEAVLEAPVASFAYPHGSHDRRSRAAVVDAGYQSAAAIKNAISHLNDDPFAVARWTVTARTSGDQIARVLGGEGVPIAWSGERTRTRAWRAVRRARRQLPRWVGPENAQRDLG